VDAVVEEYKKELSAAQHKAKETESHLENYKLQAEVIKKELNAKINTPVVAAPASPRLQSVASHAQVSAHQGSSHPQPTQQLLSDVSHPLLSHPSTTENHVSVTGVKDNQGKEPLKDSEDPPKSGNLNSSESQVSLMDRTGPGTSKSKEVDVSKYADDGEFLSQLVDVLIRRHREKLKSQSLPSSSPETGPLEPFEKHLRDYVAKHNGTKVTSANIHDTLAALSIKSTPRQCAYVLECCEQPFIENVLEFLLKKLTSKMPSVAGKSSRGRRSVSTSDLIPSETEVMGRRREALYVYGNTA
jgi:hypothetical protein